MPDPHPRINVALTRREVEDIAAYVNTVARLAPARIVANVSANLPSRDATAGPRGTGISDQTLAIGNDSFDLLPSTASLQSGLRADASVDACHSAQ
jgi:hypothetical protein